MQIIRGEQKNLKFKIWLKGSTSVIDNTATDVVIKIHDKQLSKSDGTLTYDSTSQAWVFPVTRAESLAYPMPWIDAQIAVKIGTTISEIKVFRIDVADTIIKEGVSA